MKKVSLLYLGLISSLMLITALPAFASIQDCGMDEQGVHCAYITGLNNDMSNGRYIKMQMKQGTYTGCTNNTGAYVLMQEDGAKFIGPNVAAYSICKDAQGKDCQLVGIDNFSISKDGENYTAQPEFYNINLAAFQSHFPKCDATQPGLKF